jgi:hypothetical protein
MPVFEITSPDGTVYEVEGNGSEQGALQHLQKQLSAQPDEKAINMRVGIAHDEGDPNRVNSDSIKARDVSIGDKLYDAANMAGLPASRIRNKNNAILAGLDATADSATFNFADEGEAAIRSLAGGEYDKELEGVRGRKQYNRETFPNASIAGDLGGAALMGGAANRLGLLATSKLPAAASLGSKVFAGAKDSASLGFLYGAGAGEDFDDRMTKGAVTGAISAPVGATIPVLGAGIRAGASVLKERFGNAVKTVTDPDLQASKLVARAAERDAAPALDSAAAARNGQQILNVDRGGETTRALARSAANQNPEARATLDRVTSDRFGSQNQRAVDLIDRLTGGAVDDVAYQQSIVDAARKANRPAYRKAYQYNFGDQFPREFDDIITRIPASAAANAKKIAKVEGRPFGEQLFANIDEASDTVTFARMPSIREWDSIQRGLRSATTSAYKSGNAEVANAYKGLHRELLDSMDKVNPLYKEARQGAAAFFGAEDAVEAGVKFVTMSQGKVRQAMGVINKMNPTEREGFRTGFAAELRGKILEARDRSNVIDKIFGTPAARDKIKLALGNSEYREFEKFVKVENKMDLMRNALGNSTTARQLVELGLGAGAGAYTTGDWQGAVTGAILAKALRTAGSRINENVLKKVGDILVSDDPAKLQQGINFITKNRQGQAAVDAYQKFIQSTIQAPITETTSRLAVGQ